MATSDEPATWSKDFKMGYSEAKGVLGVGRGVTSSVFSVGGHGWCVEYYPDGYNHIDADWICLRLRLVGDNDVKVKFVFSLLDQDGAPVLAYTAASSICTFSSRASSWGFERFITRRELEWSPYLDVEGTFKVRCWVTVFRPDAAMALRRNTIQPRKVEEEEDKDWMSKADQKMMKEHMSKLVARCLVAKIDLLQY